MHPPTTLQTFLTTTLGLTQPPALTRHTSIEGDDHMIYSLSNTPHILRVTKPRRNRVLTGQQMQAFDIALRRLIRDEYRGRGLSENLIPVSIASQVLDEEGVYAASLETRMHGTGLHIARATEETVAGFVDLLSILKGIQVDDLERKLGLEGGIPRIPFPDLQELRISALQAWDRLYRNNQLGDCAFGTGNIHSLLETKTDFVSALPCPSRAGSVLIHNDIKGEHVLVDECGRVTGFLDWADAGIGHVATDIAGLVLTVGVDMARRIARLVGYEEMVLEGVLLARCECVLRLDWRLNGEDGVSPVKLLREQLVLAMG
ncbi:hypothetical protein BDV25DRAFT_150473 [Aspergillus avenaceus]|uniref:Aminoglycoside phosphotransferase domain-containing protein n=1 Tax=Aspergillus avenaceus TaxID=36643 RepID=A0A5N6U2E0_ASPAV|nr:hypothetical protein BDV25DRAFT_150473 [Aspergillus avenaceus]